MDNSSSSRRSLTPPHSQESLSHEALLRELERLRVLASRDRGVLDAILEHSPHGIIVCDANGQFLLQNRAAERIWAGSISATTIQDWAAYRAFHSDGRPFEAEDWPMARCLRTREVVAAREFYIQRFDGTMGFLIGGSAPILSPSGELEGGLAVFADITELRRGEQERRQLEVQLGHRVDELSHFAQRTSLLQQATSAIGDAVTSRDVGDAVTTRARDLFGADAAFCYARNDSKLTLLSCSGIAEARLAPYREVSLSFDIPVSRVVNESQALWLCTREEIARSFPQLGELAIEGRPLQAIIAVPLHDGDRVIGSLAFCFLEARTLASVDQDFFTTIAGQCAQGIRRAALFESERAARLLLQAEQARLKLLADASSVLSSTLDSRAALGELARGVVPAIADWCAIDELSEQGEIRRLTVVHRDPEKVALSQRLFQQYPPRADDAHGVPAVLRTGQSEWMEEISDELLVASAHDEQHLSILRALRLASYAVVPLISRGRVLGALTLVCEGGRRVSERDVSFAQELAGRAAMALENARLYEAAESARWQLHDLFMRAPAAISIVRGKEQRVQLANEPYLAMLGKGGLPGTMLNDAGSELTNHPLVEPVERVMRQGAAQQQLVQIKSAGESPERHLSVVYQPTRSSSGEVDGVATFAFDVTEQVRARQRIEGLARDVAIREARLSALVEATAAIVWTATAQGEVVDVSTSWLEFTGQRADEYVNGGFVMAIHPEDRENTLRVWREAVAKGRPYAVEYRLRRRDGSYAYTLARGTPVRSADGKVVEYVGCNVDVSEQREMEQTARAHAATVETVNELGRLISAELDQDKVVQAVTDAATRLTNAQFGAFFYNVINDAGESYMLYTLSGVPREAFSKFPMPRNTAVFAPTFLGEGVVRVDDITKDPRYGKNAPRRGMPDGHLPVRSYLAAPVISRSGEVIGGIFLGHEKVGVFDARAETLAVGLAAQAAVAVDNARLFGQAQRLIRALETTNRELDQFAYVTSHDLKAPLRGIASLAEWIEEDMGSALTPDAASKLHLLRGRVKRMEALIQGILDFSRAGRKLEKVENVDVQKLLAETVELLSPEPPAQVQVANDMPTIVSDRIALQQVFLNLISNGLKHARRSDALVEVTSRDADAQVEFLVRDNGPGIAPEFHSRIWGIFQILEARDRVESTGIGLAIVKKIVEARGGRVWVDSAEGAGATFGFSWPKQQQRRPS